MYIVLSIHNLHLLSYEDQICEKQMSRVFIWVIHDKLLMVFIGIEFYFSPVSHIGTRAHQVSYLHDVILSRKMGFGDFNCKQLSSTDENKVFEVPLLHQAVFDGNLKETQWLVKNGEDPNQKLQDGPKLFQSVQDGWKTLYGYFEGTTPLMIASQRGHLKIVKFLHTRGAIISKTDSLGFNAFLLACGANQLDVCRYLHNHGAALEFRDELNGMTPLLIACSTGREAVARWLAGRGANVHACDFSGRSTLHFAAWNYNFPLIELFVSKSVKINGKDRNGNTPLHLMLSDASLEPPALAEVLVQKKEVDTIQYVLKKMSNFKDINLIIDLGLTFSRGTDDFLNKSNEKWTSLSEFVKLGANPNIKNRNGQTPLHTLLECLPEAYISKGSVIVFHPNKNQELLVQLLILLKLGADPDLKLGNGRTTINLCQSQQNALALCILNRYQNIVDDKIENAVVVEETIAKHRQKYLQKLKQVESEIEILSDMIIEPVRQRPFYEIVYDNLAALYRYMDSVVIG